MGVDLDAVAEDLKTIARYGQMPDRNPHLNTIQAYQRMSAIFLPALLAELKDHRANCTRLIDVDAPGHGWFVRCPATATDNPEYACGAEWPSHDMLTRDRFIRHLLDHHSWSANTTIRAVEKFEESGRLPKATNV